MQMAKMAGLRQVTRVEGVLHQGELSQRTEVKGPGADVQLFCADEPVVEAADKGLAATSRPIFTLATCVTSHPQPLRTRQSGSIQRIGVQTSSSSSIRASRNLPLSVAIQATHRAARKPLRLGPFHGLTEVSWRPFRS